MRTFLGLVTGLKNNYEAVHTLKSYSVSATNSNRFSEPFHGYSLWKNVPNWNLSAKKMQSEVSFHAIENSEIKWTCLNMTASKSQEIILIWGTRVIFRICASTEDVFVSWNVPLFILCWEKEFHINRSEDIFPSTTLRSDPIVYRHYFLGPSKWYVLLLRILLSNLQQNVPERIAGFYSFLSFLCSNKRWTLLRLCFQ